MNDGFLTWLLLSLCSFVGLTLLFLLKLFFPGLVPFSLFQFWEMHSLSFLSLFIILLSVLLSVVISLTDPRDNLQKFKSGEISWKFLLIVGFVVYLIGATLEEIAFRWVGLLVIYVVVPRILFVGMISSIVFGWLHINKGGLRRAVFPGLMGMCFFIIVIQNGLEFAIATHILCDMANVLVVILQARRQSKTLTTSS